MKTNFQHVEKKLKTRYEIPNVTIEIINVSFGFLILLFLRYIGDPRKETTVVILQDLVPE